MDHHQEIDRFLNALAQTNASPFLVHAEKAEECYIWDKEGKRYLDMIAGVAVNNIGHRHPQVIQAIKNQLDRYMHVMVYGEFIQDQQTEAAEKLCSLLPDSLNQVYFVNSGTEANEAALKLAKRYTGRSEIISFRGSYHGSTHGSLSVSGNETKKAAFRPLLPDVRFLDFNEISQLEGITEKTACVIVETIQGDAGVRSASPEFMQALRARCTDTGALLILDEIQCGLGRTGNMFAFRRHSIVPDILTLGKALGGGLPVGAMVANKSRMHALTHDPMLGHITTFGGNPVICAAVKATLDVLSNESWIDETEEKGAYLESLISPHHAVIEIRREGLMFAIDMASEEQVAKVVQNCLENGLIAFWFLSHPYSFRLSPPLSITKEQLKEAAEIMINAFNT